MPRKRKTFDGPEYVDARDGERLTTQYDVIFDIMKDGMWRSVRLLGKKTGFPENSIQAQLRHARKKRFGSHTVNKKHKRKGFYLYQLIVNRNNLSNPQTKTLEPTPEIPTVIEIPPPALDINQPAPIAELPPTKDCKKMKKEEKPLPLFLFLQEEIQIDTTIKAVAELTS